jgi:hypothetical protein
MIYEIDGVELVTFDYFASKLPDTTSRSIEHASKKGAFPNFVRLTTRGPALWRRDLVSAWLACRLAPVLGDTEVSA